jgi:hypothetical protein
MRTCAIINQNLICSLNPITHHSKLHRPCSLNRNQRLALFLILLVHSFLSRAVLRSTPLDFPLGLRIRGIVFLFLAVPNLVANLPAAIALRSVLALIQFLCLQHLLLVAGAGRHSTVILVV